MPLNYLAARQLSYRLPDHNLLFQNLNFTIAEGEKNALIGENGVGKSTLMKILSGLAEPFSGTIDRNCNCRLVKQISPAMPGTALDILNTGQKLSALKRIRSGSINEADWDILNNDWEIETRLQKELSEWEISESALAREFSSLSGGEKEKLFLMDAFLDDAPILLLDEPTNNIDGSSRLLLRKKIAETDKGVLIISHDRCLLHEISAIWEMTALGIEKFGGNYDFYKTEKERRRNNILKQISNLEQESRNLKIQKQEMAEKQARSNRYGEKQVEQRRYSRMAANRLKEKAASTYADKKNKIDNKINEAQEKRQILGKELQEEIIKLPLPEKPFIRGKLVEIKNLDFSYGSKKIFKNLSLTICGGERLALCGGNGCGKTTLLKLVTGSLIAQSGEAVLNGKSFYLSQNLDILDPDLTLLDNLLQINPQINVHQAHKTLANFKFRNDAAYKKAGILSGGELLKACLAAIFANPLQPDIIILDEPTNNLDIKSTEILEAALAQYQGAILAVSHDEDFLKNIKTGRYLFLKGGLICTDS